MIIDNKCRKYFGKEDGNMFVGTGDYDYDPLEDLKIARKIQKNIHEFVWFISDLEMKYTKLDNVEHDDSPSIGFDMIYDSITEEEKKEIFKNRDATVIFVFDIIKHAGVRFPEAENIIAEDILYSAHYLNHLDDTRFSKFEINEKRKYRSGDDVSTKGWDEYMENMISILNKKERKRIEKRRFRNSI